VGACEKIMAKEFITDEEMLQLEDGAPAQDSGIITDEQMASMEAEEKALTDEFTTPTQTAIAGAEAFARGATLGLSTAAQRALGADPERMRARERVNPGVVLGSEIAGGITSALVPFGGAAIAGRVGAAAARGAGSLVGQTAVRATPQAIRQAGRLAVDNAVQGALLQSGNEVHKMLVEDPEQSVSSAITNIGLAAALGGGIAGSGSLAFSAGKAALAASRSRLKSFVGSAQARAGVEAVEKQARAAGAEVPSSVKAAMVGDDVLPVDSAVLRQSPTKAGKAFREDLELAERNIAESIVESAGRNMDELAGLEDLSEAEIGRRLKDQMVQEIDEIASPLSREFDEISEQFSKSAFPEAEKASLGAKLGELTEQYSRLSPQSAEARALRRIQKDLPNLQTLDDLKNYQTLAASNITKTMGGDKFSRLGGQVRSLMREAEETALVEAVGLEAPEMVARLANARAGYREAMGLLDSINDRVRLGKFRGTKAFLRELKDMTPEKLLSRTGRGKDAEFLKLLQERLPKSNQIVLGSRRDKILRDAAMAPGALKDSINTRKFFAQYDKLSPEEKVAMFGDRVEAIDASRQLLRQLTPNINPSGTARTQSSLARSTAYGLGGIITSLMTGDPFSGFLLNHLGRKALTDMPDAARLAVLRSLGSGADPSPAALGQATRFIDNVIKGESLMSRAVKATIRVGTVETIPERLLPSKAAIDTLDNLVRKVAEADPLEMSAAIEGDMGQYLEGETGAMGLTMGRVAAYLNSQRPKEPKVGPLDPIAPASEAALNKYRRTLNIAQQPLIVMQHIKDGTLNLQDMRDIEAMYPELLGALRERVMLELTEAENQERQMPPRTVNALSLFLGVPLTASLKPQALMSNQAAFSRPPEQSQQGPTKAQAQALDKISSNAATKSQSREQTRRTQ
jgi:hypothetical protein